MPRPQKLDLLLGVSWLVLGTWHATSGEPVLGAGCGVLGVASVAASFDQRLHDVVYRPLWRSRSRR